MTRFDRMAAAIGAEVHTQSGYHWGTDWRIWEMLVQDVQSLNPDIIARSEQVLEGMVNEYWNGPIAENMLVFVKAGKANLTV